MSLLDDVSIVVTPNGYKAGELYAVVPVPTEGSELVTDGDFGSGSNWYEGTGCTISGNQGIYTSAPSGSGFTGNNVNAGIFTIGKRYTVVFTIDSISLGALKIRKPFNSSTTYTETGTYTETFIATDVDIYIQNSGTTTASISNLSVKEYTSADMDVTRATAATRVDENGLVNYAEVLGGELITNGDFTQLPLGTGWDAYTSGSSTVAFTEGAILSIDGSNSNVGVYQQNIFTSGVQYKIVVSVKATASFDALVSETDAASSKGTIGTLNLTTSYQDFSFYYTGTGTWDLFIHRKYGETAGQNQQVYIKSVSVKEVTRDNVPRIDYTGGGCPHILAEPQRTNLITYSEDFENSYYDENNGVTATNDSTTSPSGLVNASKILGGLDNAYIGIFQAYTTTSTTVTASVFLKQDTISDVGLYYTGDLGDGANDNLQIDLSSGTLTSIGSGLTASITSYNNGWYKVTSTYTTKASGSTLGIRLYSLTAGSFYAWGLQLEVGSYPTSYIPTSGSTVTRNQDQFTRDGIGSLINSTEGVLFIEMAALSDDGTNRFISLSDGTNNNEISIYLGSVSNAFFSDFRVGGSNQSGFGTVVSDVKLSNKIAVTWKLNEFKFYVNGVLKATDTSGIVPVANTFNQLSFSRGSETNPFYGKVKQLQVYNTSLSDTQLAALTS